MASYTLEVFDVTQIATDGPDFSQPDGGQYTLWSSTVTITPGAVSQTVTVDDPNDATFDDDDPEAQTLVGGYTINGTFYGNGTVIEAEYLLEVKDAGGTSYWIAAVSLTGDPYNIDGFTLHAAPPPTGVPLTIVNAYEGYLGAVPYTSSVPACFEARTRIATPDGWAEARTLRAGDAVCLSGGGVARLALVIARRVAIGARREDRPLRVQPDALGPGCPARVLVLSPQHRVWHPGLGALVPARALARLPRIGLLRGRRRIDYVHLVLPRHALVLAEGCPCESFWPGPVALSGLSVPQRAQVRAAMGRTPEPCAVMLPMRAAERALAPGGRTGPLRTSRA